MIIVVYLWKNVGYVALIYLAALQAVPRDLIEAATWTEPDRLPVSATWCCRCWDPPRSSCP